MSEADTESLLECAIFHEDLALVAGRWHEGNRDEAIERHLRLAAACRKAITKTAVNQ
jgi:hypothetical protein